MTAFFVGDTPAEPLSVAPSVNGEDLNPSGWTFEAKLLDEEGVGKGSLLVEADGDDLLVAFPTPSLFTGPGLWTVQITAKAGASRLTLDPVQLVIQGPTGWHTLQSARAEWAQAPDDDVKLYVLLAIARDAVEAYAPNLAPVGTESISFTPDPANPGYLMAGSGWASVPTAVAAVQAVPLRYRQGQLMQARNAWNASRVSPNGETSDDTFAMSTFPLDWTVRQMIRPKRSPLGVVG